MTCPATDPLACAWSKSALPFFDCAVKGHAGQGAPQDPTGPAACVGQQVQICQQQLLCQCLRDAVVPVLPVLQSVVPSNERGMYTWQWPCNIYSYISTHIALPAPTNVFEAL